MEQRLIDPLGAFYLLFLTMMAKLFTPEPHMLAGKVGNSAWLVTLLAGLIALLGYWFLAALLRRFPGDSLAGISRQTFGPVVGLVVTLAYIVYFLYLGGISLREFVSAFRLAMMPRTPPGALSMIYIGVVLFVAQRGMETLARMAAYLTPVLLVLLAVTLLGPVRILDFRHLFPIFGAGVGQTLLMPFPESSLYSEVIILGVMAAMLPGPKAISVGLRSLLAGMVGQTVTWVVILASFPYPIAARLTFPILEVVRMIELTEIVQRMEAFFVFLWFFVAALKLSLLLLCSSLLFTEIFNLGDYRPVIYPLALIIYTVAFIPSNELTLVWLDSGTLRTWSWTISFGLPAVTLAWAALRRRRGAPFEQANTTSG